MLDFFTSGISEMNSLLVYGACSVFVPFVVSYPQSGQMAPCALRPAGAEAGFAISPSA